MLSSFVMVICAVTPLVILITGCIFIMALVDKILHSSRDVDLDVRPERGRVRLRARGGAPNRSSEER